MFSNKYYAAIPLMFFYLFTGIGKVILSITFFFCYFFGYGIFIPSGFHSSNNRVCPPRRSLAQPGQMNRKNKCKEHQNINPCFQNKTPLKILTTLPQCAKGGVNSELMIFFVDTPL